MDSASPDLLRRIRDELFHAKSLVRHTRNHTKTTAAALQDSEDRLDALIAEVDEIDHNAHRNPKPTEAQGNGKAELHLIEG